MEIQKHNSLLEKGKQDAMTESYQPPHGLVDELVTWSNESTHNHVEENMEYNRGYYLQLGQLHATKNNYSPPIKTSDKSAYDKGYYNEE